MQVNIGAVYHAKADYDEALATWQEALPVLEAKLGPEHPDVATTKVLRFFKIFFWLNACLSSAEQHRGSVPRTREVS